MSDKLVAEQGSSPSLIWRLIGPAHAPQKEQALAQEAERGLQTGSQLQRLQSQPAALQTGGTTGQPGYVILSFPTISRLMQAAKTSKPPQARTKPASCLCTTLSCKACACSASEALAHPHTTRLKSAAMPCVGMLTFCSQALLEVAVEAGVLHSVQHRLPLHPH